SDLVVGENVVRNTTQGRPESVDVRYETFPRSIYAAQVTPIENLVYGQDKKAPLDLLEARNAVRIAKASNAQEYAADTLNKAESLLNQAEDYYRRKQGTKPIATVAREAVQTAEEARVAAVHGAEQAQVEQQRKENEERTAKARAEAEQAQQQAQEAQQQAEESKQRAEQAHQQAQEAQQRADQEAQQRAAAEQQQQQSAQEAEQARQQASQAQQRTQQLEAQHAQERQQLMTQLNQVLQTRDSARGLIVSMPDVLFSTGSANLKETARERLAKVAGILIAYPDIHVEVDGYTDSTGSPTFNEQLSQQRAASVQSYLAQQGVPAGSIVTRGFGQADPIASNDTAAGRQQNRRVELVVSGQSIGTQQASQ